MGRRGICHNGCRNSGLTFIPLLFMCLSQFLGVGTVISTSSLFTYPQPHNPKGMVSFLKLKTSLLGEILTDN